ncbi:MAG: hypothetical protein WA885_08630 [Phormidesmis sp.]
MVDMKTLLSKDQLGAVYSNNTLINAIDEGMVSRGVLAPKHLRQHTENGLVDTGSVHLVISICM